MISEPLFENASTIVIAQHMVQPSPARQVDHTSARGHDQNNVHGRRFVSDVNCGILLDNDVGMQS